MILIVTGGRDYTDRADLFARLDHFHATQPVVFVSAGDARGADALAVEWAKARGIRGLVHRAHWDRLGNAAGPERNARMIATAKAEAGKTGDFVTCIRFPGGAGTEDCARQAQNAHVLVLRSEDINPGEELDDDGAYDGLQRDWGDL